MGNHWMENSAAGLTSGLAALLIIFQNTTLVDSPVVGWLALNSLALLGLVFYAGKLINRLENVERDAASQKLAHDKHLDSSSQEGKQLIKLIAKMETMEEDLKLIRANSHGLRNDVMKYIFNQPDGEGT